MNFTTKILQNHYEMRAGNKADVVETQYSLSQMMMMEEAVGLRTDIPDAWKFFP